MNIVEGQYTASTIMAQTTSINGLNYAKAGFNQDLRNVKVAARTAVQPFEPVILSQLESGLLTASTELTNLINTESASRTTSEQNINNLISSNFTTLDARIQGVRKKETVVARVEDFAALSAPVAGVDYAADASIYTRWILVDNVLDTSQNGIYYQQPTGTPNVYTAVRVPNWTTVDEFAAGLEVFVDAGTFQNTVYWVFDSAVGTGGNFSVDFIPWQRPEFIQIDNNPDSAFLTKIGNRVRAEIDDTYFRVANGDLTWSAALLAWKGTIDLALIEVAALGITVAEHTNQISTLESTVAGQSVSISGLSTASTAHQTAINNLQTTDSTQGGLLSGLRTDVDTGTAKNLEQDGRLAAIELIDASQSGAIASIASVNDTQDVRLGLIEGVNAAQAASITAADSLNGVQDTRLAAIEATDLTQNTRLVAVEQVNADQTGAIASILTLNSAQDTRLDGIELVNVGQASDISGLRTDVNAGTTKNGQQDVRLSAIETLATQDGLRIDSTIAVNTTQDSRIAAIEIVDGEQTTLITALRSDTDSNTGRITAIELVDANQTGAINSIASVNTTQDIRLDQIEAVNVQQAASISGVETVTGALQNAVALLPTTTNVNNLILNFLQSSSIIRTLTNGVTAIIDGIYQTTFNIDVTSQIAVLGAGAAFRLVTLNDSTTPFAQSPPVLVNYPDVNTVSVVIQSMSGAVADNTNQVSLHAFFA